MPAAVTASPEGFPPQDLRSFLELCDGEWLALRSDFDLALVAEETTESATAAAAAAASAPESTAASASALAGFAPGGARTQEGQVSSGPGVAGDAAEPAADRPADGLPDFAALLRQARAEVEEVPSEEAWHRSERAELQVAFLAPQQAGEPGGLRVTPPAGPSRELHFRLDGSFASTPDAPGEGRWQLWPDGSVELTVEVPGRLLRERIWFTQPNLRLRSSVEQLDAGQPGRARFSSEIRRVRKPAA